MNRRKSESLSRHPRAALLALILVLISASAVAQGDAAAAEQLYKEGKALAKKGDYAAACPKFEASYKLDRGLGTLLNLADCHEQVGKKATAWAEWNEAVDLAKRDNDKRVKYAEERRDKIEPRLSKLKVEVKNPVASLSVYRNDTPIDSATYGSALAVDPGTVTLTVRRGDKTLKTETVQAKEGETAAASFDLAAIDKEFPAAVGETPTATPSSTSAPPPTSGPNDRPPPRQVSSSQKTIGFVVGGAGVAALLVAGALEVVAISKKSKADEPDQCVNKYCSPNGFKTVDDAKNLATIGQWVGIGGVLLTAVGATLVFTSPHGTEAGKARPHASKGMAGGAFLMPGGGGLSVSGSL